MVSLASWRRRSNGSSQLERKLSALQDDLSRLQRDLRGIAAAGGEIAGEHVADAFDSAEAGARAIADRAAEQLETWTNGNLNPVRTQVRSQPLASVLLSAGAGALVGALLVAARRE
jgi:ElaB/YqjD/DUF883 family membrane-anchored ribosome-binding protein